MAVLTDKAEVVPLDMFDIGRRRRWPEEEKLRIVGESAKDPRMVSVTARRYGISRSLLTSWRREFRLAPAPADPAAVQKSSLIPAVLVEAASLLVAAHAPDKASVVAAPAAPATTALPSSARLSGSQTSAKASRPNRPARFGLIRESRRSQQNRSSTNGQIAGSPFMP